MPSHAIESYAVAGNVRELRERHAAGGDHGRWTGNQRRGYRHRAGNCRRQSQLNLRQVRDEAEKHAVLRALGRVNGNLSKAADLLGVSRPDALRAHSPVRTQMRCLRGTRGNTLDEGDIQDEIESRLNNLVKFWFAHQALCRCSLRAASESAEALVKSAQDYPG